MKTPHGPALLGSGFGPALDLKTACRKGVPAIRYPVYVEIGARHGVRAFVFRLPGLHVDAGDERESIDLLPGAVREENAWLERHGIGLPAGHDEIQLEVAERIRIDTDAESGEWKGLFRYELRPTNAKDVETVLERTALARAEVLELLPATDAMGEALEERLRRHCAEELELLSRLGSRLKGKLPPDARERLTATRELSLARFHDLLPGDRERLAVFGGEKWTTRKVLRCFAVAERILLKDVRNLVSIAGQSPR